MAKIRAEINSEKVKGYGSEAGGAVVGIASSGDFGPAPEGCRPSDALEGCLSVIVIGIPFPREALTDDTVEYVERRDALVRIIKDVTEKVTKRIKADGYKARDVSSLGGRWVDGQSYGMISLKHAAELAGLGVIGKNYLLTNREYGNLLWFGAILTDADLVPDKRVEYAICDGCSICVEACPAGALNDPASFDRKECARTCFKMEGGKWKIRCYLCRKVCPHRFGIRD